MGSNSANSSVNNTERHSNPHRTQTSSLQKGNRPHQLFIPTNSNKSTTSSSSRQLSRESHSNNGNGSLGFRTETSSGIHSGTETRKSRSRSTSQVLNNNLPQTNQYLAQEKVYLKKIRNHAIDDYYTKGISGADIEPKETDVITNDDDDDDDDDDGRRNFAWQFRSLGQIWRMKNIR
ncbi:hypothetical protein CLUG_02560 [Clavispora lusitaniae ATCC 42720]|uniref:Uncharacterized protein n=1 Tax=Clavispora lusitaniae (strain ATCC 42720) TaxID=306902 RepID=C4Y4I8_CLAL4|nr:uncharacterized protein CLUG_02560 [Clavispora lusitaniae ATCC 42720]EEQ38434.1 hypothetical protein CLUG_02560 [Clavispora lusitaniae ATCC 42720]